jgi:hypothetical protein
MAEVSRGERFYREPTVVRGVQAEQVNPYTGSYVFRPKVSEEVMDSLPSEVYIVYEIRVNAHILPSGKGTKTMHVWHPIIVNGGWLNVALMRVLTPKSLMTDDAFVKYNDFPANPDKTDVVFNENKLPYAMRSWSENLVADLSKTAEGPCMNISCIHESCLLTLVHIEFICYSFQYLQQSSRTRRPIRN